MPLYKNSRSVFYFFLYSPPPTCERIEIFDFEEGALFPPTYVGGGVGTLVEPVKYEPSETACRMAEGVKRSEKAQNVHPLREDRNL